MNRPPAPGLAYLLIGQPALSSIVARALATKGEQPQTIESRYQLGINALDLTDFEFRYLRRMATYTAFASQAAVAAQNQSVQFGLATAPFGRTVLAVIEEIQVHNNNAAAQTFLYGLSNNSVGAASGPFFGQAIDDRFWDQVAAPNQSAGFVATQSNAGALITLNRVGAVLVPAGSTVTVKGPWIISGKSTGVVSTSFLVAGGQSNIIVAASFRWYEREMMSSEL